MMAVEEVVTTAAATSVPQVWAALISGSVIAAVVGALTSTVLAWRTTRQEELARIRVMLSEAYQAVAEYKEFPYAIRRRRHDDLAGERVRLSEALRVVQARLTFFEEWTHVEDEFLGYHYAALTRELRRVAGTACNAAWTANPITDDAHMNIPRDAVDLSELAKYERAFTGVARAYVACRGRSFPRARWRRFLKRTPGAE